MAGTRNITTSIESTVDTSNNKRLSLVRISDVDMGHYVVLPGIGLSVVTGAEIYSYSDRTIEMVRFHPFDKKMPVYLSPRGMIEQKNIRFPAAEDEIAHALQKIFPDQGSMHFKSRNPIQVRTELQEVFLTNNLKAIASVVRKTLGNERLALLSSSYRELGQKGILFLAQELAFAKGMSIEDATQHIQDLMKLKKMPVRTASIMPEQGVGKMPAGMTEDQFTSVFGLTFAQASSGALVRSVDRSKIGILMSTAAPKRVTVPQSKRGRKKTPKVQCVEETSVAPKGLEKNVLSCGNIGIVTRKKRHITRESTQYESGCGDAVPYSNLEGMVEHERRFIQPGIEKEIYEIAADLLLKDKINCSIFMAFVRSSLRKPVYIEKINQEDVVLRDAAAGVLRQEVVKHKDAIELLSHPSLKIIDPRRQTDFMNLRFS